MDHSIHEMHGVRVLRCAADGSPFAKVQDALDLIGDARSAGAQIVAIPAARLAPAFFQLRTGLAGEMVQKFVNYGVRLAVVGDTSEHAAASIAFRDFVRESNRGHSIWFVVDEQELADRLQQRNS